MISRNEALEFVSNNLKNKNLLKHCLATEAVMRKLAKCFGENEEEWGLAGLLHDADVEITPSSEQGKTVGNMLAEQITLEMRHAMAAHNTATGVIPESRFDYALTAGVYTEYYSEIHYALEHLKAGNLYINRKITGAVVGRQPFGGFKYSGTGGKKVGLVERLEFFMVPVSTSINKERHGVLV